MVHKYALNQLNNENSEKSKTRHLPAYTCFKPQKYLEFLSPADARLFFSIRGGTVDIKTQRKYGYKDGDTLCRLCEAEEETVEHIVNRCHVISRDGVIENCYSDQRDDVVNVVSRVKEFQTISEEMESDVDKLAD